MKKTIKNKPDLFAPRTGFGARLWALLSWSHLSLGVSRDSGELRHALVAFTKGGCPSLLSHGKGISWFVRVLSPLIAHGDLGCVPVSLSTFEIDGDPDIWVDRHEDTMIPRGLSSDQIINEYEVSGSVLYSAVATKKAIDKELESLSRVRMISLSIPLWNLSALYRHLSSLPFVLWKISSEGSVIGVIDGAGRLSKLCNYWVSSEDVREADDNLSKELGLLVTTMKKSADCNRIIVFCPEKSFQLPANFIVPGYTIELFPSIPGVAPQDYSAYANALHEPTHIDFAPFSGAHKARALSEVHRTTWRALRLFGAGVASTIMLLLAASGLENLIRYMGSESLSAAHQQLASYEEAHAHRDSLLSVLKGKAEFFADRSRVTVFLDALQEGFPEGTWAEEISISEIDRKKYRIDMRAIAYSSTLIGSLVARLQTIPELSGVRMAYSEQTTVERNRKAIRIRIEGLWSEQ